MRQRIVSYLAAACINLAIVSGTLTPPIVEPHPIVRIRQRVTHRGRFAEGETAPDGSIAVCAAPIRQRFFSAN
jgi:hypothetical protein